MQCQSPQQIRKVLLGSVPTSDEEGFILAKGAGSEILTLLALCGADLKVFWTRSNICISDRITQPKLPLLFLTVFSKNVLIFGSEIWIFPSIRILGPSLHIGGILSTGCQAGHGIFIKGTHITSASAIGGRITIKQTQEIKPNTSLKDLCPLRHIWKTK